MNRHISDKLMSAYLDDLVGPEESEFVRNHVSECAQCAERLAQFNLLEETIAEMDPQAVHVDDAVFQQVRDRVLRKVSREKRASRDVPFGWWLNLFSVRTLAYVGMTILLLGSVIVYVDNPSEVPESSTPAENRVADVPKDDPSPMVESNPTMVASADQLNVYRSASGFLSTVAKKAYSSASEEAQSWKQESRLAVGNKLAAWTKKSEGLLTSAKSTATEMSEAVENHGSRALDAAAKQALPQAGIAAGTTLIQLIGAMS